jgi:repressor of nif and glnA expression
LAEIRTFLLGVDRGKLRKPAHVTLVIAMANFYEEFKIKGQDLVDKVKSILHEGNVRRIILKDEKGHTFLEIPLSIAALGVVAAPLLAGLGAIAALVSNFTLVVERSEPEKKPETPPS